MCETDSHVDLLTIKWSQWRNELMTDDRLDPKLEFKVCWITHFIIPNIKNQKHSYDIRIAISLIRVLVNDCSQLACTSE